MLALDIRNINKKYPHFQLRDVSFQLEQDYIMGFVGANGAGKTTSIKATAPSLEEMMICFSKTESAYV